MCARIARLDPVAGHPRRVSIVVDGAHEPRITSARVARSLGLVPGVELDESELKAAEQRLASERALALLAARERSVAELAARLGADGFPEQVVHATVERLVELGAADDARFAHAYTLARLRAGDAPELIIARLRSRGIAADLARRTVLAFQPDALALALRALGGERPRDPAQRARLLRRLARKGFDMSTALKALDLTERDAAMSCHGETDADEITSGS